jgi:hypothetical protein
MIASVEKYQRKYATFTDDEKIGIVEAFVDCENLSEKRTALTHLKEIMSVKDSEASSQTTHKVRYLINKENGCIITSQYKAWNDTVRMAMILKPLAASRGGKFFLWMDNVSSHKTDVLEAILKEAAIEVGFFPPNMTQYLQILDLVVNGPLKAHIRRKRGEILLDYFRQYKVLYNAEMDKPVDERIMPRWSPPKPTVHECIMELMHVMYDIGTRFTSEEFKTNVENTFVNTGTLPTAAGTFKQFSFKPSGGTTSIAPTGTHLKYSKCASDLDIAESQVNDYICEDIIESWIFNESLDDFDPDIFDNDTLQLEE